MKPQVEITDFQRLDLRAGTVKDIRPHPSVPGLSIFTVQLDQPVETLAPASAMKRLSLGAQVVVALGLHPLLAGGQRFTASLVAGPLAATPEIPGGSRLS